MVDSPTPNTAALVPSSSNIKRLSTVNKVSDSQPINGSPVKSRSGTLPEATASAAKDVVSPGELCGFVDSLLSQLETKFDDMSEQLLCVITRNTCNVMKVSLMARSRTMSSFLQEKHRGARLTTVDNMSARIDSLENSIHDLMQDGIEGSAAHAMPPSDSPIARR